MISSADVVNQSYLARSVKSIFPDHDIKVNSRKTGNISNPNTGKFLELDIWIPSLSISFEFQDPYHYTSTWESHEPLQDVQLKDSVKSDSVKQKGETLIIVPCWWDGLNSSLQATVSFYRPDLAWKEKKKSSPIPLTPKIGYLNSFIPQIGALMLASFPVTLKLDETLSPETPWWMGEKYDGVRFCWNARARKIYTRSGMEVQLPSFFYPHFPRVFLDGEFWLGRGNFQDAQRIVLSIATLSVWSFFRTVVFDNPDPRIRNLPFESRYSRLLHSVPGHPFLIIALRKLINDHVKLERSIRRIMEDGGEGVILRRPKSVYEHGRSSSLLKLKASREDREALVVLDKNDAIVFQTPEGATFSVPKEECVKQISAVPKKGDIVTFTYDNLSRSNSLISPKLLRIRKDVSWESVVQSTPQSQFLSELSSKYGGFSARPTQYWSVGRQKNARTFFEKVAKSKGLDPLHTSTWYGMRRDDITKIQGAVPILTAFSGSIVNAILHTFPDIGLEKPKFRQVPKSHWQSIVNRRKYFEQYAKNKGFDPLIPNNWYSVQVTDFLTYKSGGTVLYQSQESKISSFAITLREVFPELKFDDTKFPKTPTYFLKERANRRQVLEHFAERSGFDPLNSKNWYSIHSDVLYADKAVLAVMRIYDKSLVRMLLDLYPSIPWDPSLFRSIPNNYWLEPANRRNFFEKFAKQKRFDPLIASNWFDFNPRHIINQGGATVLQYYNGDVQAAVRDLFPELKTQTPRPK